MDFRDFLRKILKDGGIPVFYSQLPENSPPEEEEIDIVADRIKYPDREEIYIDLCGLSDEQCTIILDDAVLKIDLMHDQRVINRVMTFDRPPKSFHRDYLNGILTIIVYFE